MKVDHFSSKKVHGCNSWLSINSHSNSPILAPVQYDGISQLFPAQFEHAAWLPKLDVFVRIVLPRLASTAKSLLRSATSLQLLSLLLLLNPPLPRPIPLTPNVLFLVEPIKESTLIPTINTE